MAVKTREQLLADLAANFPDNTTGAITAAIYRAFITDVLDSASYGITPEVQNASFSIAATDQDGMMYIYNGSGAGIATIAEASTFPAGHFFLVYQPSDNITLNTSGSDTINGQSSLVMTKAGSMFFVIKMTDTSWLALRIITSVQGISSNYVPIIDANGELQQSSIEELTDRIRFSKTIEVPGGSVQLAGSQRLSAGTRCLIVENVALDEMGLIHFDPYSDTGSSTPKYLDLGEKNAVVIQSDDTENSPVTPFTFTYTVSEDRFTTGVILDSNNVDTGSVVMRYTDEDGGILAEITDMALVSGKNEIDLPNGMVLKNGDVLHYTVTGLAAGTLKGGTIGNDFVPYLEVNRHLYDEINLDYPNDIVDAALDGTDVIRFTRRDGTTFDISIAGGGDISCTDST